MLKKRGRHYHLRTTIGGIRYEESLGTTDHREARGLAQQRIAEIQAGKGASVHGRAFARLPFAEAMEKLIEERVNHVAPRTHQLEKERAKPLCAHFGSEILAKITASAIAHYQNARLSGTGFASPVKNRTVNMELALLRLVLDRAKLWSRLAEDVRRLPESTVPVGRALSTEELKHLFAVAGKREGWLVVRCAMAIALSTAGRGVELKHLRWRDIDFFERMLRFERSKTAGGIRSIPLREDAILALSELRQRSEALQAANSDHYVFPATVRAKAPGSERTVERIDPTRPMNGWRTAWRALTREAAAIAEAVAIQDGRDPHSAGKPFRGLRFHDLRHCSITILAEGGVSDATLMSISGHLSKRMLDHYSQIRMKAKREAVEKLPQGLFRAGDDQRSKPKTRAN